VILALRMSMSKETFLPLEVNSVPLSIRLPGRTWSPFLILFPLTLLRRRIRGQLPNWMPRRPLEERSCVRDLYFPFSILYFILLNFFFVLRVYICPPHSRPDDTA